MGSFFLDKFFEEWVINPQSNESIYASNDQSLKDVLERVISMQIKKTCHHLNDFISAPMMKEISEMPDKMRETKCTKYS